MAGASWAVAATVSEPPALVLAFVASCLARGAVEVRLFLDGPQPELEAVLRRARRCRVTVCDDAYWAKTPKGRPWEQTDRQRRNVRRAYAKTKADWLLHIDADEFLWGPDPGEALARLPDHVDFASVRVAERVHLGPSNPGDILGGAFRRAHPPELRREVDRLDGRAARFLREGTAGYPGGKGFFRVGRDLVPDIHEPRNLRPGRGAELPGHLILHFDGLTPRAWIRKKQRMVAQMPDWWKIGLKPRRQQLAEIERHGGDEARLLGLYRAIKELSPERAAGLERLGLLVRADHGIREALAEAFPGVAVDLSAAAFDAAQPAYPTSPRPKEGALLALVPFPLRRLGRRARGRISRLLRA